MIRAPVWMRGRVETNLMIADTFTNCLFRSRERGEGCWRRRQFGKGRGARMVQNLGESTSLENELQPLRPNASVRKALKKQQIIRWHNQPSQQKKTSSPHVMKKNTWRRAKTASWRCSSSSRSVQASCCVCVCMCFAAPPIFPRA